MKTGPNTGPKVLITKLENHLKLLLSNGGRCRARTYDPLGVNVEVYPYLFDFIGLQRGLTTPNDSENSPGPDQNRTKNYNTSDYRFPFRWKGLRRGKQTRVITNYSDLMAR